MVKLFTRIKIIKAIRGSISNSPYECSFKGHGRAGNLLEDLLGIKGSNHDVADAVGFELKTTLNPNTPVTLFHKDPKPRGRKGQAGATQLLVHRFGWPSEYGENKVPVTSFRATIWGEWKNKQTDEKLNVKACDERISILHNCKEVAYWDSNDLIGGAAAKLRNMMFVEAKVEENNKISFVNAFLLEDFQPFRFLKAIENGIVAIDFDARTNPGKETIRNHGTKFRIRERDLKQIYRTITKIDDL